MNATKSTKSRATKSTKIIAAAVALFGITLEDAPKRIPAILYALGIREACGRCGGSGSYSWCRTHGTTCFGCGGHGEHAAPLTAQTLEAARVKVEAGELIAIRAAYAAKKQARREIAPLVEQAREVYDAIAKEYSAASSASAHAEDRMGATEALVASPLFRAQTMNNALFWGEYISARTGKRFDGVTGVLASVKDGSRRDYLEARAEVMAYLGLLIELRNAWTAFKAGA